MKQHEILFSYILEVFGLNRFTTEFIYRDCEALGIPRGSVGSVLNQLKMKGYVENDCPQRTRNGRIQKIWFVVQREAFDD